MTSYLSPQMSVRKDIYKSTLQRFLARLAYLFLFFLFFGIVTYSSFPTKEICFFILVKRSIQFVLDYIWTKYETITMGQYLMQIFRSQGDNILVKKSKSLNWICGCFLYGLRWSRPVTRNASIWQPSFGGSFGGW